MSFAVQDPSASDYHWGHDHIFYPTVYRRASGFRAYRLYLIRTSDGSSEDRDKAWKEFENTWDDIHKREGVGCLWNAYWHDDFPSEIVFLLTQDSDEANASTDEEIFLEYRAFILSQARPTLCTWQACREEYPVLVVDFNKASC